MILDKGLVIDAFVRVSLIGIEVLTVEAKVVVASIDTYLRYAEAVAAIELPRPVPAATPQAAAGDVVESVAHGVTRGALDAVQHTLDGVTQQVGAVTGSLPVIGDERTREALR